MALLCYLLAWLVKGATISGAGWMRHMRQTRHVVVVAQSTIKGINSHAMDLTIYVNSLFA